MGDLEDIVLPHLHAQFERGRVVLFTGAGFSLTAKNLLGEFLPSSKGLAEKIWPLCFPSVPFDESSSLQDLYETALTKNPKELAQVLVRSLTIMPASVEDWLADYFFMPWHRIYTLNIDNLAQVIAQRFSLPRHLEEVSATNLSWAKPKIEGVATPLEVVYLNGMITDIPANVTFAATQYAHRLAFPDSFYQELMAEIVSRPVIFIGTRLDEPPLWQNIEIRKGKGPRGVYEFRPRCYLVTPTLDRAREARLAEFNIMWIPMTAQEFSKQVLKNLSGAREAGLKLLRASKGIAGSRRLEEVSDLATDPQRQSEFLLGHEPIWADIQSGRAIERVSDREFGVCFSSTYSRSEVRGVIVVAGTAGSGKSTSLMRLALNATAAGHRVAWIDRSNELTKREVITAMKSDDSPTVLLIDDADLFGWGLSTMIKDILSSDHNPLVVVAVRSGIVDRVINPTVLAGIPIRELVVPLLTDTDIDLLIAALDRENRLGRLKGKTINQQRAIFRESAGRQLLVAMISATSGEKLEEKIPNEFFELAQDAQRVYAVVSLATTFRYRLSRQDVLTALNDSKNEILNSIELLLRRHILVEMPPVLE
jgi:Mrp family chromosome partitioning ATPase